MVNNDDAIVQELFSGPDFVAGLKTRREVLGAAYVDASVANTDAFMAVFQKLTTEWCWNYAWNREGLDRKTRSMLNLAMLTAAGKPGELALHVRGALNNGVSVAEIQEILLQATIYCGIPSGLEAFKTAHQVLLEEGRLKDASSTNASE
ncbi:carboxymuconolactone decarboxylase family protein [Rathayibacter soli]|uniref:carboxymuconolactone decarboxylase family protein n=1 Tax=Rathayibacter soli TaxID=3144168 RepID=UPI0027E4381A|nr:carboxymuconolactone decarboxylase family protein [Glaciibacter superstes]